MTTTTINRTTRELAYRSNAGIEVTLLWNALSDELTVTVFDSSANELLELPADRERALDVFNHPFAYAARSIGCFGEPVLARRLVA